MEPNAFAGQAKKPTETALAGVLGRSHALWRGLVADLRRELKLDKEEWHSSSVKTGWSLRLQSKERNIVYLSPRAGYFVAAFALGDNAVQVARASQLPAPVMKTIADAKRYAEGTAVRIDVRQPQDVAVVIALATIKLQN